MVEPFLLAGELALRLVGEARGVLFRAGADRELLAEALGRLYLWIVAELEREPEGHLSPLALGRRAIRRHARNAVRAERQVRFREVSLGALETGEEGSELPACATAGDPTADPVLERVWLNQILAGLPAHQRKVAEDCLAGKAYEEIAAARGVSLQAVRQLWLRTAGRLGADAEKKPGRVQNRRSE
jgi:DNA-directed RNA polymerase specialized sigma24 family protein